jgi:ABC-2 type transport system permease protein
VDNGDRVAAVVIGPGFTQRADALDLRDVIAPRHGKLAGGLAGLDVAIRSRPTLTVTGSVVEQWVLAEALRVLLPHVARRSSPLLAGSIPPDVVAASSRPAPLDSGKSAGPEDDNVVFNVLVPSYTVLFTFFLINLMARSLIHERQMGTLFRLRAAPISSSSVLAGQTVPFFMVSVVQGILLFVFGRALFGMSWGHSPAMLLPVLICTSLAATGLGLLTATLVTTEAQVSTYATLLVIGLAGISGCFMPRDWLPDLVRDVSLATPHAWALIAYDRLLVRPGADSIPAFRGSVALSLCFRDSAPFNRLCLMHRRAV